MPLKGRNIGLTLPQVVLPASLCDAHRKKGQREGTGPSENPKLKYKLIRLLPRPPGPVSPLPIPHLGHAEDTFRISYWSKAPTTLLLI